MKIIGKSKLSTIACAYARAHLTIDLALIALVIVGIVIGLYGLVKKQK